MLATWGAPDYGETIHSLGINYLTAFGRSLGFWAASEYPVRPDPEWQFARNVRPDVAWFQKPSGDGVLLGEFERYESTRLKRHLLRHKAENLVLAYHQLPVKPQILLLAVWTTHDTPVQGIKRLRDYVHSGFRDEAGNSIPAPGADAAFIVVTFVMYQRDTRLVLGEVLR